MTGPLLSIFSFSFLVALTGAMSPGPLLTYTIIRSASAKRRGYLMGFWIIAGHAVTEMAIILVLLSGFSMLLKNVHIMRLIGLAGGVILIWFGITVIRGVRSGEASSGFPEKLESDEPEAGRPAMTNPILGGALVSISNPYWWVWWATIGLAFMLEFHITLKSYPELLAFYLGHEAGDMAWYLIVSTLSFYGIRRLDRSVYSKVLVVCGLFMMVFGVYLGVSPFLSIRI